MTLEILQQRLKDFTDHLKTQVHPLKNQSSLMASPSCSPSRIKETVLCSNRIR